MRRRRGGGARTYRALSRTDDSGFGAARRSHQRARRGRSAAHRAHLRRQQRHVRHGRARCAVARARTSRSRRTNRRDRALVRRSRARIRAHQKFPRRAVRLSRDPQSMTPKLKLPTPVRHLTRLYVIVLCAVTLTLLAGYVLIEQAVYRPAHLVTLGVVSLLLLIEALFIFRPVARQIERTI